MDEYKVLGVKEVSHNMKGNGQRNTRVFLKDNLDGTYVTGNLPNNVLEKLRLGDVVDPSIIVRNSIKEREAFYDPVSSKCRGMQPADVLRRAESNGGRGIPTVEQLIAAGIFEDIPSPSPSDDAMDTSTEASTVASADGEAEVASEAKRRRATSHCFARIATGLSTV